MPRIEKTIEVEVPLEKGFWYIADGENWPKWYPSLKKAKRIKGKVGPSSVMHYIAEIKGKRYEFETRVVEWDPPRRYLDVSRFRTRLIKHYMHEGRFKPTKKGFKYTFILDYRFGPPGLGWLIERLRKREIERSIEEALKNLKSVLEHKFGQRGREGRRK